MYYVYILRSLIADKSYVGITDNAERRLYQHNNGYHKYTKIFKPWKLIYKEAVETRVDARVKEKYFKSCAGRKWLKIHIFNDST